VYIINARRTVLLFMGEMYVIMIGRVNLAKIFVQVVGLNIKLFAA